MAQENTLTDEIIKTLVRDLVQQLVDRTDHVRISLEKTEPLTIVHVELAPSDFDRVLGRNGVMARSLGIILNAAARKVGTRYVLAVRNSDAADSSNKAQG